MKAVETAKGCLKSLWKIAEKKAVNTKLVKEAVFITKYTKRNIVINISYLKYVKKGEKLKLQKMVDVPQK